MINFYFVFAPLITNSFANLVVYFFAVWLIVKINRETLSVGLSNGFFIYHIFPFFLPKYIQIHAEWPTARWRWFIVPKRMLSEASECLDGHRQIVINLIDHFFIVAGAVKLMCKWRLRMTYICARIYVDSDRRPRYTYIFGARCSSPPCQVLNWFNFEFILTPFRNPPNCFI